MQVLKRLFFLLTPYWGALIISALLLIIRAALELVPPLFQKVIIDEATSSVDAEAEYLIQQALEKVLNGRTALVIAHRLSTIRNADKIIVLDQGRIVEVGNHRELMSRRGLYRQLYTRQMELTPVPI